MPNYGQRNCSSEAGHGGGGGAQTAAMAEDTGECKSLLPKRAHRVVEQQLEHQQQHQQAQQPTAERQHQPPMPLQQLGGSRDPRRGQAQFGGPRIQLTMPDELEDDDKVSSSTWRG